MTGLEGNKKATTGGGINNYEVSRRSRYQDGQVGHHTAEPEPGGIEGDGEQTNLWWDDDEDVFLASQSESFDDQQREDGPVNQPEDGLWSKDDIQGKEDDQIQIWWGRMVKKEPSSSLKRGYHPQIILILTSLTGSHNLTNHQSKGGVRMVLWWE